VYGLGLPSLLMGIKRLQMLQPGNAHAKTQSLPPALIAKMSNPCSISKAE